MSPSSSVSSKNQTLDDLDKVAQKDHNNKLIHPLVKSELTYSSNPYLPIRSNPSLNFPSSTSNIMGSVSNHALEVTNLKTNEANKLKTRIYSHHQSSNTLKDLNPPTSSDTRIVSRTSFGSSRPITAFVKSTVFWVFFLIFISWIFANIYDSFLTFFS